MPSRSWSTRGHLSQAWLGCRSAPQLFGLRAVGHAPCELEVGKRLRKEGPAAVYAGIAGGGQTTVFDQSKENVCLLGTASTAEVP